MKASVIFKSVSAKLQDYDSATGDRWPWEPVDGRISLVELLNSAVRQITLQRPDATAVTESVKLAEGMLQSIPVAGQNGATKKALRLIELHHNMGSDGEIPGEPIFIATKEALDTFGFQAPADVVDNYAYDAKTNPSVYWVSPGVQSGASVYVSLTYSAEPEEIKLAGDDVPIPVTFSGPIEHWMLYEIFSGDNSDANFAKAQHHLSAFYQALGVKLRADLAYPKQVEVVEA